MNRGRVSIGRVCAFALATVVAVTGAHVHTDHGAALAAPRATSSTSVFEPINPHRFADTRRDPCGCTRLDGQTIRVELGETEQIPNQITAAAVTVTVTGAAGRGFATVYSSGSARPTTSTVNYVQRAAVANSTIIGVGPDGAIEVYLSSPAHVIVDVTGVFTAASEATSGRFVPLEPTRILDGRNADAAVQQMAPGSSATIDLPSSVPADATAVAVNVTSVRANEPGFFTAFAAGGDEPTTSFLNVNGAGTPVASSVIVPASPAGISVRNTAGGRLIVDLAGYFTGPSAPLSNDGLFVATTATRLLDTRNEPHRLWSDGVVEVASPHTGAAALVTNLTAARTDGLGYVSAYPAGLRQPVVSSLNPSHRDQVIANGAITRLSTRGIGYYGSKTLDLIVDTNGYFTGQPVHATEPVPANEREPRRVLMVGDSTLAVVRNVTATQELFVGFDTVLDAQGCRRLVWPSCFSDTDFAVPNTIEEAILGTPGVVDVVVVMSGYNDWHDPFGSFVDIIMEAARSKGARQVVWLTLSEGRQPETSATAIGVFAENTQMLWDSAPRHPDLVIADWRTYNTRSVGWMSDDGVHLRTFGGFGLADYLSRWIAHLDGRPCPQPFDPGGVVPTPCPSPNTMTRVPDIAGLYGVNPPAPKPTSGGGFGPL